MSSTVYNADFTRLLPEPLKNDEEMLALGRSIAGEFRKNIQLARRVIRNPNPAAPLKFRFTIGNIIASVNI